MRVPVILFAVSLMLSCTEYDLADVENPTPPADDDDTAPPDDDDSAGPDEECDGIDNDGDGQIDEGYMDADHDGIADCVDDDCDVVYPPQGEIPILEECEGSGVVVVNDPWNVAVEWTWTSGGSGVIVMPAVGNLTDDNGDGSVDELDMPDIAFTVWGNNRLVALHGDGSGVIFDVPGYDGQAGVTIADVDVDGFPEIVAGTTDHRVAAVDATGAREWASPTFSWSPYPQPAVADLEGDGDVEIVFDIALVEGANGAAIAQLNGVTTSWRTPVIADLDADGTSEIIVGEKVFACLSG